MTDELNFTAAEREELEALRSRVNVARAISFARVDQGLSQDELGRKAGTKQSRVSEIENLDGNPRFDTLDRISRALGLMIDLVPRERRRELRLQSKSTSMHQLGEFQTSLTSVARIPGPKAARVLQLGG